MGVNNLMKMYPYRVKLIYIRIKWIKTAVHKFVNDILFYDNNRVVLSENKYRKSSVNLVKNMVLKYQASK